VSGEADLGTIGREAGDRQVTNLERVGSLNTGKPVLSFWKASESSVSGFAGVNGRDESRRGSVGTKRRDEDPEEEEPKRDAEQLSPSPVRLSPHSIRRVNTRNVTMVGVARATAAQGIQRNAGGRPGKPGAAPEEGKLPEG